MAPGYEPNMGEHVAVYNANHLSMLLESSSDRSLGASTSASKRGGHRSRQPKTVLGKQKEVEAQRREKRYSDYLDAQDQRMKASERVIKDSLERQAARRDAKFQANLESISDPESRGHLRSVNKMVELHEQEERRKNEHHYLEWRDDVYLKIQQNINKQVDELPPGHSNRRRREAFQQFLDVTNNKGPIFRDIIIESEYVPCRKLSHFALNHDRLQPLLAPSPVISARSLSKFLLPFQPWSYPCRPSGSGPVVRRDTSPAKIHTGTHVHVHLGMTP